MKRLLLLVCSVFVSCMMQAEITWEKDYNKALDCSQNTGRPLLVFFTGSDWSGWSMKMKKEILDAEEFKSKIENRFVCVEIDFPEHKAIDSAYFETNQRLKEKLHVRDYPRLLVLAPQPGEQKREIARFGYSAEKPAQFAQELLLIVEKDEKLTQALTHLDDSIVSTDLNTLYHVALELKRKEDAKRILDVGVLRGNAIFLLEKYRLLVEEGHKEGVEALHLRHRLELADPKNERGIPFALCLIDFQSYANEPSAKARESVKPLEDYLSKFGEQDLKNRWRLEMMIAQVYLNFDEWKSALNHAEVAYECAPKEQQEEILHSLDYIRQEAKIALK